MCRDDDDRGGLICRRCGCRDFRVEKTDRRPDGSIRRLRKCRHCGYPLRTVERPDRAPPPPDLPADPD